MTKKKSPAILIKEDDGQYTIMFVDNPDWSFNVLPNRKSVDTIMKILNYKVIKTYNRKDL
jgi:hypothetical protein